MIDLEVFFCSESTEFEGALVAFFHLVVSRPDKWSSAKDHGEHGWIKASQGNIHGYWRGPAVS